MKQLTLFCALSILLTTNCAPPPTPTIVPTAIPTQSMQTALPTSGPSPKPSATPDLTRQAQQAALLYSEDFESGAADDLQIFNEGQWQVVKEHSGNSILCSRRVANWAVAHFGTDLWTDYAVEMRMKMTTDSARAQIQIRSDDYSHGYTGSLGYQAQNARFLFNPPKKVFAEVPFAAKRNIWNTFRMEAAGDKIRFLVDDQLLGETIDTQRAKGKAGFLASEDAVLCVDDIRVWALTPDGQIAHLIAPPTIHQEEIEVVTNDAATGDGGNAWGGHQTRIVQTRDGIFTAYTVEGSSPLQREWRLASRQGEDNWIVIAEGESGKDPVNLLASPDGTLHIVAWPSGAATLWSGTPEDGALAMTTTRIPNQRYGNWPYGSAGIDTEGNLCVLSSEGGAAPGGRFYLSCYLPAEDQWVTHTMGLDYRFCYTYVFPLSGGGLSLVSTRDVRWEALGYEKPPGAFGYVFNALGVWRTDDAVNHEPDRVFFQEETPTAEYPDVVLNGQQDAYVDTQGRIHSIYRVQGASTRGAWISRHAVISPEGNVLSDRELPDDAGAFSRIFQDGQERYYILGSLGVLYTMDPDGLDVKEAFPLNLAGYAVEYSGYGLSVPRTGTPLSSVMHVVFPSAGGTQWLYFQLDLSDR